MDPLTIFAMIKLATQIGEELLSGTHVQGNAATISALEDLVAHAVLAHQAEAGKPMDLTKFGPQGPAEIPAQ